jgi:hypothetical protein
MRSEKAYIGDSVYIEPDNAGGYVLTTENGGAPSNTIYLEPEVAAALVAWLLNRAVRLQGV